MSDNNQDLQRAVVFITNGEDSASVLQILESMGFACEVVADEYQLEIACTAHSPNLIYMHDVSELSITAMASLRQTLIPDTPILFGVEHVNATLRDRITTLGLADYVIKPVQYDELLHRVRTLLSVQSPIAESSSISLENQQTNLLAIYEIGQQLSGTLDQNEIFRLIYKHIAKNMFHSSLMSIATFDAETQMIRCVFAIVDDKEGDLSEFPPMPLGEGPNSDTIRTRQIQIVDLAEMRKKLEKSGRVFRIGDERLPMSAIYIPLIVRNRVIGVLNIQHYDPHAFDDVDKNLLNVVANQAAIALENASLYKRVKQQVQELEALYRSTGFYKIDRDLKDAAIQIAEAVVREFSHIDCGVMIVEDNSGSIIRLGRAGSYQPVTETTLYLDGPGLVPEAIRTGQVVYAPDVSSDPRYIASDSRTKSELVVPLPTYERIIGVLDLQSKQTNAFSQSDIRIIKAFAERAAAVIENVILYNQTINYAAELEDRVKERTKEYREALGLFEAIFNGSSDAVFVLDSQGEIQQANRIACELFQMKSQPKYPQFTTLFDEQNAETIRKVLNDVMALNQPLREEVVALRSDGKTFPADAALYPIFESESNDMLGVVCSLRDITERKRHEARLKAALNRERELNELRARFVTTVSHGFRTPMAR
ncbi:MAG: GAF domain-containing protein, partial [Chloroflexi bacterium]